MKLISILCLFIIGCAETKMKRVPVESDPVQVETPCMLPYDVERLQAELNEVQEKLESMSLYIENLENEVEKTHVQISNSNNEIVRYALTIKLNKLNEKLDRTNVSFNELLEQQQYLTELLTIPVCVYQGK